MILSAHIPDCNNHFMERYGVGHGLGGGRFLRTPKTHPRHMGDCMNYLAFDRTQDGHGGRGEEHQAEME